MRNLLLMIAALSPWAIRRRLLAWLCNATFGKDAYVGRSFVDTKALSLADGARIGSLNSFRRVAEIRLAAQASIGNLNWVSGASHKTGMDDAGQYTSGRLTLGRGASITNRHYIDIHADIAIGAMALVAGVRSTLLTHSIDFAKNRQATAPIEIGDYTFVGSNAVLLPGARISAHCIVAAGSVVARELSEPKTVYGGVPARKLRDVSPDEQFFTRQEPFVD